MLTYSECRIKTERRDRDEHHTGLLLSGVPVNLDIFTPSFRSFETLRSSLSTRCAFSPDFRRVYQLIRH